MGAECLPAAQDRNVQEPSVSTHCREKGGQTPSGLLLLAAAPLPVGSALGARQHLRADALAARLERRLTFLQREVQA